MTITKTRVFNVLRHFRKLSGRIRLIFSQGLSVSLEDDVQCIRDVNREHQISIFEVLYYLVMGKEHGIILIF